MNKIIDALKWVICNFFPLTIAILALFYLRWFRLAPFVLLDDPTFAFIGGLILLILYLAFSKLLLVVKNNILRVVFGFLSITLLVINAVYLDIHIPRVETRARCNGVTYYLTYGHPLGDEQWTYVHMSKWNGISYQSHFFGYAPDAAGNKIVCDEARKEAHFIKSFGDPANLIYIDGENPQAFEGHNGARLKNRFYFMSEDWSLQQDCANQYTEECSIVVFMLYECELDYTNCNRLRISYTADNYEFIELRPDESRNEISLMEEHLSIEVETLIFTYGENPVCYVEGCTIDTK